MEKAAIAYRIRRGYFCGDEVRGIFCGGKDADEAEVQGIFVEMSAEVLIADVVLLTI